MLYIFCLHYFEFPALLTGHSQHRKSAGNSKWCKQKMNNIRFLTFWLACPASKISAWMSSSKLDVGLKVAKKFKKTWLLYNWGCCEADSSKSRHCLRRCSSSVFLKRLWRPMLGRCPDKCRLLWIRWRFWWSFLKSERLFWVTSLVLASGIPSG